MSNFRFISHPEVEGMHALLSASKYSWLRYDDEKIVETIERAMASAHGTRLHNLAAELIRLAQKLPKTKQTLNLYVNDAIGFRMSPEVMLFYSEFIFGTADAISFRKERGFEQMVLRVHDLKTGTSRASIDQLQIYAALFCLEYSYKPHDIYIELRIYQNDYAQVYQADPSDILHIMNKIEHSDKLIREAREEAFA